MDDVVAVIDEFASFFGLLCFVFVLSLPAAFLIARVVSARVVRQLENRIERLEKTADTTLRELLRNKVYHSAGSGVPYTVDETENRVVWQ